MNCAVLKRYDNLCLIMMKEKKTFQPLTSNDVCQIYETLHQSGEFSFALTNDRRERIATIIASIFGNYFGVANYATPELQAAALLYFITKDHPFVDGNKRMAVSSFRIFCRINNLKPTSQESLDELVVFIGKDQKNDAHVSIHEIMALLFGQQ